MTNVAIYTDAGAWLKTKIAAWSCYIEINGECVHKQAGILNDFNGNVSTAELSAIANALMILSEMLDQTKTADSLTIYTDSRDAQRLITGEITDNNRKYLELPQYKTIEAHTTFRFNKVDVVHIKAHTVKHDFDQDRVKLIQHWCDIACGLRLKMQRYELDAKRLDLVERNITKLDTD